MDFAIRPARAPELADLPAIEVAAGAPFREIGMVEVAEDEPPGRDWYARRYDAGLLWVAHGTGGQLCGYLAGEVVDGEAHLAQVSVLPAGRGRRVGAALIETLAGWAGDRGHERMTLTTFADVAWNGPYYRQLGWRDLDPAELGPELAAIRERERRAGLDRWPRCAMARDVRPDRAPR